MRSLLIALAFLIVSLPLYAGSTPLVTGNGFGFAVVSPETGAITKFYAHPYSFAKADLLNPLAEGIETANFIKQLRWNGIPGKVTSEYQQDSQVIRVSDKQGEELCFMPFGFLGTALIIDWLPNNNTKTDGHFSVSWSHRVRVQKRVRVRGQEVQILKFEGIHESLLLVALEPEKANRASAPLSGSHAWALISLENEDDVDRTIQEFDQWRAHLAPRELADRELSEIERWRVKTPAWLTGENALHVWRQSEIVLRLAQSREPNRPGRYSNGLIVAALPDGSWFMPWVRDMAFAAVAMAQMGHQEEARAALMAYFNARPTGKMKAQTGGRVYQISVCRYFGDGEEEPFFTMEGATNIEFDDWGLALWALGEYVRHFDDVDLLRASSYRGSVYESAKNFVVAPLLDNLEPYKDGLIVAADTSIWEEHQKDKKHFAFSTAAAIVGLRHFADLAQRMGDEKTSNDIRQKVAQLERGFNAAFIRNGSLHGTLEEGVKNDIDGALLAIINLRVVTDRNLITDTVRRMELLKVNSGGYRRVRSTYTDPSIYEYWYEREEFVFVDLSLAEVHRRLGQKSEATAMVNRIVDKAAADNNIIPEMYVALDCKLFHGDIGDPTGAVPMVGYGAGAYILNVLQEASPPSHD